MSKIEIGTLQLLRKPSTCSLSYEISGPQISGRNRKLFFLFLNQTYVVGAQITVSTRRFFCAPKTHLKLMGKKINTIFLLKNLLNWP